MRGTVDPLPSGRWRLRIGNKGSERKTFTFETREEAESNRVLMSQILDGSESVRDKFGDLVDDWITSRKGVVADSRNERSRYKTHIENTPLAEMSVRSIRTAHVHEWLESVQKKNVARQTALNVLQIVRGTLKTAVRNGTIKVDPSVGVSARKQRRTDEPWTYLTNAEISALLAATPPALRPLVSFAIGTGLRAGEICSLRLVDVKENEIVVRYGGPPNEPTKGGRVRRVPLFGLALEAVEAVKAAQKGPNPHGLLFPRAEGGYRDPNHVLRWDMWKKIRKRANIDRNVRWHDLRHTCASALISGAWGRAWRIEEVREVLGHSTIAVTQRYAHLSPGALATASQEAAIAWSRRGHAGFDDMCKGLISEAPPAGIGPATFGLGNLRPTQSFHTTYECCDQVVTTLLRAVTSFARGDAGEGHSQLDEFVRLMSGPSRIRHAAELLEALNVATAPKAIARENR